MALRQQSMLSVWLSLEHRAITRISMLLTPAFVMCGAPAGVGPCCTSNDPSSSNSKACMHARDWNAGQALPAAVAAAAPAAVHQRACCLRQRSRRPRPMSSGQYHVHAIGICLFGQGGGSK